MIKAKLTISLFLSFLSLSVFSQSYLGGEIQVSQLKNGDFEFNVTYIQNCVSCSEGANCDVPKTITLEYGNRSLNLNLKTVDVEPYETSTKCSDCNRCTNDTCALRYGFSTYKLQATANFDSITDQNYCTIKAEVNNGLIDQENSTISAALSKSILLTTEFNACIANSTPTSAYFGGPICLGRDAIIHSKSYDLENNETNKLVYSLAPVADVNGNVDYLASYDFDKPMNYLGFPRTDLKFPRGFHLDSTSGILMFRPMKAENFIVRIKVEEYRASQWLSTSYKDLHFEVIKCPNNNAPIISGINCTPPSKSSFNTNVVVGETVCFNVCTSDKDKSDSLKIDWNQGIDGATFTIIDSNALKQTARFCWTPTEDDISQLPHTFVVNTFDNGCQFVAFSARSFQITVKDKPRFDIKTDINDCGVGKIILQDTGAVQAAQYMYAIGGRVIVKKGSPNDTVEIAGLTTGYHKYTITAIGVNGANNVIEDSLYSNGNPPFNTSIAQFDICENDTAFFTGSNFLSGATTLKWSNNTSVTDTMFYPTTDEKHYVVGTNGTCTDTLEVNVNVIKLTDKIEAKYRSGSAPLYVSFALVDSNDADTIHIDFGDNKNKTLLADQFPHVHEYQFKGTYNVTYQVINSQCGNNKVVLNDYVNVFPTAIGENPVGQLEIFPNPSKGFFFIKSEKIIRNVKAYNITGKSIELSNLGLNQYSFKHTSKGVFVIEVEFENGELTRERLIIK
ncbi:MAG: T9SS type A sorting domain-containing protein [Bacteroidia bacterium]